MMQRRVNQVSQLKSYILKIVQEYIDPVLWQEFIASERYRVGSEVSLDGDYKRYHGYAIADDDLPIIRDLKAFINMLTAIERGYDRATQKYSLYAVSIFKRGEVIAPYIGDVSDFRRNYKVYMSTNSFLTNYLDYIKDVTKNTIIPEILSALGKLLELCTSANFQKGVEFFIEQIITLEQYQQKYLESKRAQKVEDKPDNEGIFTTASKKSDILLRMIYKDKYNAYFSNDKKDDDNKIIKERVIDYYVENIKDNETVRHVKKLLNGIIGIKKVLDDYTEYKKAGVMSGVSWMGTFIMDLRKAYTYLQEFEYQAILAEQSLPLAEYIKLEIKQINGELKKLACIADRYEVEGCLKDFTLLQFVDTLIKRYDQITTELNIPTDYSSQKRVFYKARLESRQVVVSDIESQISLLNQFLLYHDTALADIPVPVKMQINEFIKKYNDDISMDRSNLAKYQTYLLQSSNDSTGIKGVVIKQLESLGNRFGMTIHAEFMTSLHKRQLYLKKQIVLLNNKLRDLRSYSAENPYDNFKLDKLNKTTYQELIWVALREHLNHLMIEKDELERSVSEVKVKNPPNEDLKSTDFKELIDDDLKVEHISSADVKGDKVKLDSKSSVVQSLAISVPVIADPNDSLNAAKLVAAEKVDKLIKMFADSQNVETPFTTVAVTSDSKAQLNPVKPISTADKTDKIIEMLVDSKLHTTPIVSALVNQAKDKLSGAVVPAVDIKFTVGTETQIGERLANQIKIKNKECKALSTAIEAYEKSNNFNSLILAMRKEGYLGLSSIILLEEIEDILAVFEKKPAVVPVVLIDGSADVMSKKMQPF
jgi:hypothetical protein